MLRLPEILLIAVYVAPTVWALSDILRVPTDVWADSQQNQALWTVIALVLPLLGLSTGCGGESTVELAVVLPLTGEWSIYGEPIRQGVELAITEVQERKDLPYRVKFEILDSESDPVRAAEVLETAYRDGALAAVGGVTSAEALSMLPVAEDMERLLLSPSASSPALSGISRYFFRVFPSDFREGTTMGNFVAQKRNITNLAILSADTEYAKGVSEVFEAAFERVLAIDPDAAGVHVELRRLRRLLRRRPKIRVRGAAARAVAPVRPSAALEGVPPGRAALRGAVRPGGSVVRRSRGRDAVRRPGGADRRGRS